MTMEHVFGLYNYWVVIFLMMTGFYIVIAHQNFIKTIIGLNIFQISVILLYITMGKVEGGTAPIIPPKVAERYAAEHDHGHGAGQHVNNHDGNHDHDGQRHGENHNNMQQHSAENDDEAVPETAHAGPAMQTSKVRAPHPSEHQHERGQHEFEYFYHSNEEDLRIEDIRFSNPLPSVLMLTAIVVGVATTALALALTVRIKEDYGTIEEDEVLEMDRRS